MFSFAFLIRAAAVALSILICSYYTFESCHDQGVGQKSWHLLSSFSLAQFWKCLRSGRNEGKVAPPVKCVPGNCLLSKG